MENRTLSNWSVSYVRVSSSEDTLRLGQCSVPNIRRSPRKAPSKSPTKLVAHTPLHSSRKSTVLTSKKKDEEKFNAYTNNTNDAWEIDEGAMTLKILDDNDDEQLDSADTFQQVTISEREGNFDILFDHSRLFIKIINQKFSSSRLPLPVRKAARRQHPRDFYAGMTRKASSNRPASNPHSTANNAPANLSCPLDLDPQKKSKFQQILEQSSVDLSECRVDLGVLLTSDSLQMNSAKSAGVAFPNSIVLKRGNYSA